MTPVNNHWARWVSNLRGTLCKVWLALTIFLGSTPFYEDFVMMFRVIFFLIAYLLGTTLVSSYFFLQRHETISPLVISLFFFLWLNSLICIWEISLGLNIKLIKDKYLSLKSKHSKKRAVPVLEFMLQNLTLSKLFSLVFWSEIWSL